LPYDTSYPYYLGGEYPPYRGFIINRKLNSMSGITAADMQSLQSDNYNVFAEIARPVLLKYIDRSKLNTDELNFLGIAERWNLKNGSEEEGASVFTAWFDSLETVIYTDDFPKDVKLPWPHESTLLESLIKDSSAYPFVDNVATADRETVNDAVTTAFKNAVVQLKKSQANGKLAWGKFKDSGVRHLLKLDAFSRMHLNAGGGNHVINAYKKWHGPSWKMVVHLTDETEAYGIYPGGQSGNPGSKYYDDYIDNYVALKYNRLWNLNKEALLKMKNLGTIHFEKATA
jgi:penicillin G amidase